MYTDEEKILVQENADKLSIAYSTGDVEGFKKASKELGRLQSIKLKRMKAERL